MYNLVVLGCCAAAYFIINLILAHFFKQVAYAKGFDDKCHAWALVFWLGLFGCLYVCALPDLNARKVSSDLLEQMRETGEIVRRNTILPTEEESRETREEIMDKVTDTVLDTKEKVDDLKEKATEKIGDVKETVADVKDNIKENIGDVKDSIKENISDIKEDIKGKLSGEEKEPIDKAEWAKKSLEMIEEAEKGSTDQ